jgi:5'(3')-deoxyribonucleotidase
MANKYKVYVDIDGVLADFDAKGKEITDGKYGSPDFSKGQFWKAVYKYNKEVEPFFESLPKMRGADKLMDFITTHFDDVALLTATGTTPRDAPEQKKNWGKKSFPGIEVKTVQRSVEKAIYANPRAILIDDRDAAIGPWRKTGGIGILFKDADQVIAELQPFIQ